MPEKGKRVLSSCPLCGDSAMTVRRDRKSLGRPSLRQVCNACSAEFAIRSSGLVELVHCDPRHLALAQGLDERAPCKTCQPCLLGTVLPVNAWEHVKPGATMGVQPDHPLDRLSALPRLLPGEAIEHVSFPAYVDDVWLTYHRDEGALIVTNRRVLFESRRGRWAAFLQDIVAVHDAAPGFAISLRDRYEPIYFFPPPGDTVAARLRTAVERVRPAS